MDDELQRPSPIDAWLLLADCAVCPKGGIESWQATAHCTILRISGSVVIGNMHWDTAAKLHPKVLCDAHSIQCLSDHSAAGNRAGLHTYPLTLPKYSGGQTFPAVGRADCHVAAVKSPWLGSWKRRWQQLQKP